MPEMKGYALMVGNEGAPRLKLLNEMCNPSSLHFIERNVDLTNKHVLDLGCGIGILTAELAEKVLPNGTITAADISQDQLEIAKIIATKKNNPHILFKKISAINIDQLAVKFDLIFCRFLLAHLSSINEIITKITTLMHEDSLLICEEPNSVESLYCEPSYPIFERWKEAVTVQVKASNADFNIGKNLSTLFSRNNLTIKNEAITQAQLNTPELKKQLWLGILEITPLLLTCGYASADELDALVQELKDFAESTDAKIGYVECTQIAGKLGCSQS